MNVSVADVTTGQALYGRGQDDGTVPASVTKLVDRGDGAGRARPGVPDPHPGGGRRDPRRGGASSAAATRPWRSDKNGFYPGAARLDDLAAQVKQALGGTAPTRVTVDSSLFTGPVYEPGWDDDIPTGGFGARDHRADDRRRPQARRRKTSTTHGAAERVAAAGPDRRPGRSPGCSALPARRGQAGQAAAGPGPRHRSAPAPGTELGTVQSLPMVRLVDIMISDSDNVIAEALARQVALARNQPASFAGGAAAMDAVIGELGLPGRRDHPRRRQRPVPHATGSARRC